MTALLRLLGLESGADVLRVTASNWHTTRALPWPWLALFAAAVLVLAAVNFAPRIGMRVSVRLATALLRLALGALLLAVLLGVEWHLRLDLGERQQWTVLVDDSASMGTRDAGDRTRFAAAAEDARRIANAVDSRVDVALRTFSGAPLGDEPGQGPTPFGAAVAAAALSRAAPDRLVLLTDGRDSERRDLRALGEELKARSVAFSVRVYGSEQPPLDAGVSAEPERTLIRLGEDLVVRGAVTGLAPGSERQVRLLENGREVKRLAVAGDGGARFELRHRPAVKGRHTYGVQVESDDPLARNNRREFTADVVEEKINVLLLEGYPRYEFKILKAVLEVDPLVNLVSVCHLPGGGVYVQGQPLHRNPEQGLITSQADLFKYDVVILRDVPRALFREGGDTTESRLQNLVQFVTKRGGGLVVLGGQDVFRAGGYESTALAEILPFDLSDAFGAQPQFDGLFYASIVKAAYDHPLLRLLPESAANRERLNGLRPLDGANNVGRFKPMATPLMTRRVEVKETGDRRVPRDVPVLACQSMGEGRVLAAAVDSLWRWQLQAEFDDPPLTMLLANAVRYLAPPPERRPERPSIALGDGTPQVGQELVLSTDLRDANFDPIRNADLVVTVTPPDGSTLRLYPRDLPEEPGHYEYRVPLAAPGPYRIAARHGKNETVREFLAGANAGEFAELSADPRAMDELVAAAGGERVPEVKTWLGKADTRPTARPAERDLQVWNSPLVLLLFVLLVSADCYVRKRQGLV
jgi:hypothetical protein